MKKSLVIILVFLSLQCRAEEIKCPYTLTCNYDAGTCEMPHGWGIESSKAIEPFYETLNLNQISAYQTNGSKRFELHCTYQYREKSSITIIGDAYKLQGSSWVFYGFGKKKANCGNNDFDNCTGFIPDECSKNIYKSDYYISINEFGEKFVVRIDNGDLITWIPPNTENRDYKTFLQYLEDNHLTVADIPTWPCD